MVITFKNILLIDDDEITNFLNERVLKCEPSVETIKVMHSSTEAIDYLKNVTLAEKPNLIFLDINMPAMNGWEFLEEYQKINPSFIKDIIVIMLTTSINPEDKDKASAHALISDFKVKPLTSETIKDIMNHNYSNGTL